MNFAKKTQNPLPIPELLPEQLEDPNYHYDNHLSSFKDVTKRIVYDDERKINTNTDNTNTVSRGGNIDKSMDKYGIAGNDNKNKKSKSCISNTKSINLDLDQKV